MIMELLLLSSQEFDCGTEEHAAAVRAEIEGHNAMIERFVAEGNIDVYAAHFTDDAIQLPPNNAPLMGREAIHEWWTAMSGWGTATFDLNALDVEVCGPQAVELGAYTLTFEAGETAPEGMASFTDEGHYIAVWVDSEPHWKIKYDAPVSTLPLPGGGE